MTKTRLRAERLFAVALNFNAVTLSDERFRVFRQNNDDVLLELTAKGELLVIAPTYENFGPREQDIYTLINSWAKYFAAGPTFDSSTVFRLPNGARRSPIAAWIRREKWEALSQEEQEGVVPLCPDFVLEIRHSAFRLAFLQEKMDQTEPSSGFC